MGLFAGLALLALLQFPPADGPPQIVLKSRAGMQVAALGSSCGPSNGAFMCLDTTEPHPSKMTLVRRGEAISIRLVGRRVLGDSEVSVRPYGCRQEALESFPLEPGDEPTGWTVDVPPGDYELHVFARYAYGKAGRGDVSGALGLRVDDSAALTVAPAPIRSC